MKIHCHKTLKMLTVTILATANLTAYANCTPLIAEETPTSRVVPLNDGSEVKDKVTGLIWQRCSIGQVWRNNTCTAKLEAKQLTWHEALKETKALGNGYRLPTIRELQSILEFRCHTPAINSTVFPNTNAGSYWSSSPVYSRDWTSGSAWYVDFTHAISSNNGISYKFYARAVRLE